MFFKLRLQVEFHDLVDDLYLVFSLRVINRREAFLDLEVVAERTKFVAKELCSIIRNDLPGYHEMADDGPPNKFLDFLAGDRS